MTKKLHRFLLSTIPATDTVAIAEPRFVHQVHRVLKLRVGEQCIVFQGGGPDVVVEIIEVTHRAVTVRKIEVLPLLPRTRELTACIAIAKGATFELIVQKLTEIGVARIVPILSDRVIKGGLRIDRLHTISDEALEQSGGNMKVAIDEPTTLQKCLGQIPGPAVVFDLKADPLQPSTNLTSFYIGPEGGWSEADMELFEQYRTSSANLGPRILRTETAAIVAAYTILAQ